MQQHLQFKRIESTIQSAVQGADSETVEATQKTCLLLSLAGQKGISKRLCFLHITPELEYIKTLCSNTSIHMSHMVV